MDSVELNIGELTEADRSAAERLVGRQLRADQQIRIEVISPTLPGIPENVARDDWPLPDWFNVYEGLTEAEIDEITNTILSNRFQLRHESDPLDGCCDS